MVNKCSLKLLPATGTRRLTVNEGPTQEGSWFTRETSHWIRHTNKHLTKLLGAHREGRAGTFNRGGVHVTWVAEEKCTIGLLKLQSVCFYLFILAALSLCCGPWALHFGAWVSALLSLCVFIIWDQAEGAAFLGLFWSSEIRKEIVTGGLLYGF